MTNVPQSIASLEGRLAGPPLPSLEARVSPPAVARFPIWREGEQPLPANIGLSPL
jgi:hypothetical protein